MPMAKPAMPCSQSGVLKTLSPSHRRDCHFADALSLSLLKHLLKVEGDAAA